MQSCADYITFNVGSLLLVTHSVTTSGCFVSPLRQVYSVSLQHAWLCVNECDTLKVTYSLFDDSNSKSLDFTVNRFLIKLLRPCCYRPIDVVNERGQIFLSYTQRNDNDKKGFLRRREIARIHCTTCTRPSLDLGRPSARLPPSARRKPRPWTPCQSDFSIIDYFGL